MDQPIYVDFVKKKDRHYEYRKQPNGKVYVYECLNPSADGQLQDKWTLLGAEVPGDPTKLEIITSFKLETVIEQLNAAFKALDCDKDTSAEQAIVDHYLHYNAHEIYSVFAQESKLITQLHPILKHVNSERGFSNFSKKIEAVIEFMVREQSAELDDTVSLKRRGTLLFPSSAGPKVVAKNCIKLGSADLSFTRLWKERLKMTEGPLIIKELPPREVVISSQNAEPHNGSEFQHNCRIFIMHAKENLVPAACFMVVGDDKKIEPWEEILDFIYDLALAHQCEWVIGARGLSDEVATEFDAMGMSFIVPQGCKLDPDLAPYELETEESGWSYLSNREYSQQDLAALNQALEQLHSAYQPFLENVKWSGVPEDTEPLVLLRSQALLTFCALSVSLCVRDVLRQIKVELKAYLETHDPSSKQAQTYQALYDWLQELDATYELRELFEWFRQPLRKYKVNTASGERWSEPTLERDRLFYGMIGLGPFPRSFTDPPNLPWLK